MPIIPSFLAKETLKTVTHELSLFPGRPGMTQTAHHQLRPAAAAVRGRQLYKNISMLFLFPVKDGKLSTGVNATFDASCYG